MTMHERYTTFDAILDDHECYLPALERAISAAERLVRGARGVRALDQAREASSFLFVHALPHMAVEESTLFPSARCHGASEELIARLVAEHDMLRAQAARARAAELEATTADDFRALGHMLLDFVRMFERHVDTEEALLAGVPGVRDEPL